VIKVVILLSRRDGMSPEEFARHTRDQHLPLVAALPGLRRLVFNTVLPDPNGPAPTHDAIAEDWFDDAAAMAAAFASPAGQAVFADAPHFLDMSRVQLLVVEEEEIPLPAGSEDGASV
jgi:uncharacterized protein (TIGR02118 family)